VCATIDAMINGFQSLKSCRIAWDKTTTYSLGLDYFSAQSATKGLQLNEHKVDDETIQVSYSRRPEVAIQD